LSNFANAAAMLFSGVRTRGCVVPLHKELAVGTLRGVLKQAGVSTEEFMAQL
jgi:hypothetical protein